MRAQDLIRAVLDALDQDEIPNTSPTPEDQTQFSNDPNRFAQVFDLLSKEKEEILTNRPKEQYADIEAVTTLAGGGLNGPKNPHDLRVKDPSMYPNQQEI